MYNRIKKSVAAPLASIAGCFKELGIMGGAQSAINKALRERDAKIAKVQDKYDPIIAKHEAIRSESLLRIYNYAVRNLPMFCTPNVRSRSCGAGQFGVRSTTPKVELIGVGELTLIEQLRADPVNTKYVRVTYTLDREAMLADRPQITGVKYVTHDEVFAKPKIAVSEGKNKTLSLDI